MIRIAIVAVALVLVGCVNRPKADIGAVARDAYGKPILAPSQ